MDYIEFECHNCEGCGELIKTGNPICQNCNGSGGIPVYIGDTIKFYPMLPGGIVNKHFGKTLSGEVIEFIDAGYTPPLIRKSPGIIVKMSTGEVREISPKQL